MPDTPVAPAADPERAPSIAAATLLKKLGYDVDAGGPLYFISLAKFIATCTEEERKLADTPEGLLLVLHRKLDAKLNAEAPKEPISPAMWIGIGVAAIAAIFLIKGDD